MHNTHAQVNDSYAVLLRQKKLPLSLLEDPEAKTAGKTLRANLLQVRVTELRREGFPWRMEAVKLRAALPQSSAPRFTHYSLVSSGLT